MFQCEILCMCISWLINKQQKNSFINTRKVVLLTVYLFQSQHCSIFLTVDTLKSFHSKAKKLLICSEPLFTRGIKHMKAKMYLSELGWFRNVCLNYKQKVLFCSHDCVEKRQLNFELISLRTRTQQRRGLIPSQAKTDVCFFPFCPDRLSNPLSSHSNDYSYPPIQY